MNDEQLKQRIAYLVENGALDDPLADIARRVRVLTLAVCGVGMIALAELVTLLV